MKNRFSKMGKQASLVLLLLTAGGLTSCKDDYTLDDEKPSWLNSSIYESLQEKGNFKNYLRLLGDPDVNPLNARPLTEVLSRTGSKTVFVTTDDMWEEFFRHNATLPENNPWHTATSYDNLSVSQKKLLIHTSMLNDAIVMENLASSEGDNITRGEYMRRYTDVETTDTVTYLDGNSLPISYNTKVDENGKPCEADYWWRFREANGGKGIYLVCDSSTSMMSFFTSEYLSKNNITDNDFNIFMGTPRVTSDVHIYNAKLSKNSMDIVAENGYVNITDKVIYPLPNMAEALRTSGKTRIISHILDRWSAPFYSNQITEAYKDVMASRGITWTDSIFVKRYFSDLSYGSKALKSDPQNSANLFNYGGDAEKLLLPFDPGWNAINTSGAGEKTDMAAMFVPNDVTLWKYFTKGGGGWGLIETYCDPSVEYSDAHTEEDFDKLFHNIDQIPTNKLQPLLAVMMRDRFSGSVPSKMTTLRDDANEQIYYPDDIENIESTILANNGVVYVMNEVYGPAAYRCVAGPVFLGEGMQVINFAIFNGSTAMADYMGLNYYAYLMAMRSQFAFFIPTDEALKYYYDPLSFKSRGKSRVINYYFKGGNAMPITGAAYNYAPETGEIGAKQSSENIDRYPDDIVNRLKDILESHTIVLDGIKSIDEDIDEYYLSKNGTPIKVIRENGKVVKVQGAFQIENQAAGVEGFISDAHKSGIYTEAKGVQENIITESYAMQNGTSYKLDSPLIPASRSVFNILSNDNNPAESEYEQFYNLCRPDEEIIKACGLVDISIYKTTKDQEKELKKYRTFIDDNGPDNNIAFFNNYNYTAFIPTNQAVEEAIGKGLPTWDSIREEYENCEKDEDEHLVNGEDSLRLQAKITYLINFVRYHFADNSVFVDKSTFAPREFVTSSFDAKKELFCKIKVQRVKGINGTILQVLDANNMIMDENSSRYMELKDGGEWTTIEGNYNIMARDVSCSSKPTKNTMNNIKIEGSSAIVLHEIPHVLNYETLPDNGNYDRDWVEWGKQYKKRYEIPSRGMLLQKKELLRQIR